MLFDLAINPRVFRDWRHCLAFGFGSGLARRAPGTWGTLAAVPFSVLVWWCLPVWGHAALLCVMGAAGVWICHGVAQELGVHDHGGIVWDEWVGYGITLWAVPFVWWAPLLAFALFRFFDIAKPWPVSWCDRQLHGGLGIMLDDVVAGLMACAVMQVCVRTLL